MTRTLLAAVLFAAAGGALAQGALLQQVRESNRAAAQLNQQREARFAAARDQAAAELRAAQAEVKKHEGRVAGARRRWEAARATSLAVEKKIAAASRELEILYDSARGAAVDLHDTARGSLVTTQFPDRIATIAPLAASQTLPGPAELEALWRELLLDMQQTGAVARYTADLQGEAREVTRIGPFVAFAGGEYFVLGAGGQRLLPMERQPPRRFRNLAREFEELSSGAAPMLLDPTRGPLLIAEANTPGLFERLWHSGLGGYFIAGILGMAVLLAILQSTWLRSRLILDEQSISVTVGILAAFALLQWWFWRPGEPAAQDEIVAMVDLVQDEPPAPEDEPPPPEITPPPPPPDMPTAKMENALAGLPALAAPNVAPLVSNLQVPVKIAGGGSLTGLGFGGFAKGSGTGAGTYGKGQGFSGKPLIPLSTARPQMPDWACKQGIKGWVEAVFTVLPNGRVQDVKIVDAQPRGVYEMAAVESISNWIYAETDRAREVKQRVPMDPADCAYNWR